MQQDYDDFKVGDKVWCYLFGEGEVFKVSDNDNFAYPVYVQFDKNYKQTYTKDGRHVSSYKNRTLFFSEPKIEGAVKRPFTPTLIGKNIVIDHLRKGMMTMTVAEEDEEYIRDGEGVGVAKSNIKSMYELGEKLK